MPLKLDGLGEIISRVNATVRVGIDNEKAVITAAKSKIYKGVNFKCGSFSDAAIDLLKDLFFS